MPKNSENGSSSNIADIYQYFYAGYYLCKWTKPKAAIQLPSVGTATKAQNLHKIAGNRRRMQKNNKKSHFFCRTDFWCQSDGVILQRI